MELRVLVALTIEALLACPNHGKDLSLSQVDLSDCVVLGVAQVNEVLIVSHQMAHALGVMERGLLEGAIDKPLATVPNNMQALTRLGVDHD